MLLVVDVAAPVVLLLPGALYTSYSLVVQGSCTRQLHTLVILQAHHLIDVDIVHIAHSLVPLVSSGKSYTLGLLAAEVHLHHLHPLASGCALHIGVSAATAAHHGVLVAAAVLVLELLLAELLLAELLPAELLLLELLLLEPLPLPVELLLVGQVLLPVELLFPALLPAALWPTWLPAWLPQRPHLCTCCLLCHPMHFDQLYLLLDLQLECFQFHFRALHCAQQHLLGCFTCSLSLLLSKQLRLLKHGHLLC